MASISSAFKMSLTALLAATLVFIGLLYVLNGHSSDGAQTQDEQQNDSASAIVDFVVDGDTVDLRIGTTTERVRLIGIDTPETVDRNTPKQCYGSEATMALRELLPEGTEVRIERDTEPRDRFGRLLLYVYRSADQLFVNRWMVDNGYAAAISYRPNVAFETSFTQAESKAKQNQVGLWGACEGPNQPLE